MPSEDSNLPVHLYSLIIVFAGHFKSGGRMDPKHLQADGKDSGQTMCGDAQADTSLLGAHAMCNLVGMLCSGSNTVYVVNTYHSG